MNHLSVGFVRAISCYMLLATDVNFAEVPVTLFHCKQLYSGVFREHDYDGGGGFGTRFHASSQCFHNMFGASLNIKIASS